MVKTKEIAEFGDFQTPLDLAYQVCQLLKRRKTSPASIIEPTCGKGAFLQAAMETFPRASRLKGLDINPAYIAEARHRLPESAELEVADFFATDWPALLEGLPSPLLIIGNPPWVTNAELGTLKSNNLPQKSNFQKHVGFDAITGKSNFDISEWMLIRLLEWLNGRRATVAMLCKTAVARKVLAHSWKHNVQLGSAEVYAIDTMRHFGAAVDACLLLCDLRRGTHSHECAVFDRIDATEAKATLGYRNERLLANVDAYDKLKQLEGESPYRWRSGVKHDCSKVMEFTKEGNLYRNGLDELVDLEDTYVFPMLKSSEVANGRTKAPKRWMLVTQRTVGEDTSAIKDTAPKTWHYLEAHADLLNSRGSSIYKKRPPYSVFGIGDYTFANWKVAISGFYKRLGFAVIGTHDRKPIVLDDTSYFLSCGSKAEAEYIASLLNSETAREFFSAYIFWDAKRPITAANLALLNLQALAETLGSAEQFASYNKQSGLLF